MADELIVQIAKRFPPGAVIGAALRIPIRAAGAVTVLFGPSGSGKTTILRCLAGLERPERGIIVFGDEVWHDSDRDIWVSPQDRRIGHLFQDYALFPHLSARANIEYGLRRKRSADRHERVSTLLDLFEIRDLADRRPRELSGGEAQRVALARTLAPGPRLLLLDEPLSALDAPLRARLRTELRRILTSVAIPTIIVTHDRTEAIALGDRLAVVVEGRVQQTGSVEEVFARPANLAVVHALGVETVVPGTIVDTRDGLIGVDVGGRRLFAVDAGDASALRQASPERRSSFDQAQDDRSRRAQGVLRRAQDVLSLSKHGGDVFVCIRAEEVILRKVTSDSGEAESARNHVNGVITSIVPEGPLVRVSLDCGFPLVGLVTRHACEELKLSERETATAVVKATSVRLIPRVPAGR